MKTDILKKEVIKIFKKFGLNNNHALISANALINAELVGAYGHGLSRLKMYCERISKKVINPKPKIKIKSPPVRIGLAALAALHQPPRAAQSRDRVCVQEFPVTCRTSADAHPAKPLRRPSVVVTTWWQSQAPADSPSVHHCW